MKRYVLILLASILTSQLGFSQTAGETVESKIEAILRELASIVRADTSELVADTINCGLSRIQQNMLRVVVVPDSEYATLGQARFQCYVDDPARAPEISLNKKTLDLYPQKNSLLMALFVNQFKRACDYFAHTTWYTEHRDNILERYLYDMDALYVEAQFIKQCILDSDYEMTKLESFIVSSLDKDDLSGASVLLFGVDKNIVYDLYTKRRRVADGKLNTDELLRSCVELGRKLAISDLDTVNWSTFIDIVRMRTYEKYLAPLINPIISQQVLDDDAQIVNEINELRTSIYQKYSLRWQEFDNYRLALYDNMISN
jgi:hypothetical protein